MDYANYLEQVFILWNVVTATMLEKEKGFNVI